MEFHYSFQATMELDLSCLKTGSFEDDLYYAELERQIMKITTDDEDVYDDDEYRSVLATKTLQNFSPTKRSSGAGQVARIDIPVWEIYRNHSPVSGSLPSWLANPWRQKSSNGTGVFIPQTAKSRTAHASAGRTSHGKRMHRQMENSKNQQNLSSPGSNKRERRSVVCLNV